MLYFVLSLFAVYSAIESTAGMEVNVVPTSECPTWYIPVQNSSREACACGSSLGKKLMCLEGERVSMLVGSCITYTDEKLLFGSCPYAPAVKYLNTLYIRVPKNISEVNEFMCSATNRTGLLCSQCQEGLSLAAMSYRRECVECSNPGWGIVIFLALTIIPATLFFLLVTVCSFNITSGPMNAPLVIIHVLLAKINESPSTYLFRTHNPAFYYLALAPVTFYGFWNLDFLRYVIPPFCISRSLTSLQAEALEYVVAVYPLLLIVVTYICVEMYDREYQIITALWTPFRKLFDLKIFKDLNIKHSLIKSFATFLILSYAKIFNISRAFLDYNKVWNSTRDVVKIALSIDASTFYASSNHIPYMILASFMILIFNLLPLILLLLYPMKCFQLLLGKFPGVNWHPLRAFMDIFQGCYKNGTDGTKDCRYFAALNLLLRIIVLLPMDNQYLSTARMNLTFLIFIVMLAFAQPYQRSILNSSEIFFYSLILMANIWIVSTITFKLHYLVFVYFLNLLFFTCVCFICSAKVLKALSPKYYNFCVERIIIFTEKTAFPCCCYQHVVTNGNTTADLMERGNLNRSASHEVDEEYPDRMNNPQDYQPLLGPCDSEPTYGSL